MIIKNNFNKEKINYLEEEKKGLEKAVLNFDKRYKKGEVLKDNFLKQNEIFSKRGEELLRKMKKRG